jgi:hypothetical protein
MTANRRSMPIRTLKQVLADALPDATALGGPQSMDRKRLVVELDHLSGDLRLRCWTCVALIAIAIVAMAGLAISFANNASIAYPAFAAAGLVALATTPFLRRISDELARIGMLQTVASDLTLEALTEIAQKLEARL